MQDGIERVCKGSERVQCNLNITGLENVLMVSKLFRQGMKSCQLYRQLAAERHPDLFAATEDVCLVERHKVLLITG